MFNVSIYSRLKSFSSYFIYNAELIYEKHLPSKSYAKSSHYESHTFPILLSYWRCLNFSSMLQMWDTENGICLCINNMQWQYNKAYQNTESVYGLYPGAVCIWIYPICVGVAYIRMYCIVQKIQHLPNETGCTLEIIYLSPALKHMHTISINSLRTPIRLGAPRPTAVKGKHKSRRQTGVRGHTACHRQTLMEGWSLLEGRAGRPAAHHASLGDKQQLDGRGATAGKRTNQADRHAT